MKSGVGVRRLKPRVHRVRKEKTERSGRKVLQGEDGLEKAGKEIPSEDRESRKGWQYHAVQNTAARSPGTLFHS